MVSYVDSDAKHAEANRNIFATNLSQHAKTLCSLDIFS
jgi:hypothetical protein